MLVFGTMQKFRAHSCRNGWGLCRDLSYYVLWKVRLDFMYLGTLKLGISIQCHFHSILPTRPADFYSSLTNKVACCDIICDWVFTVVLANGPSRESKYEYPSLAVLKISIYRRLLCLARRQASQPPWIDDAALQASHARRDLACATAPGP